MFRLLSAEISFPDLGISLNPPEGFPLFGLYIRFYSIIIVAGILLALLYAYKVKDRYDLSTDNILDAVIYGTPAAIIGARLYYVIFEWDSFTSFWDIFKIWNGGLAIYGAIIAAFITGVVYSKLAKISLFGLLDVASLGFLIGQSVGRWGNFFNREAYGTETELPWRMDIRGMTYGAHPTFLYESLWNILGFILLHFYSKNSRLRRQKGEIFVLYMGWYGLGRSIIEGLRTDSLYIGDTDIRVSQFLGALFFIAAVVCFILLRQRAARIAEMEDEKNYVPVFAHGEVNAGDDDTSAEDGDTSAEDGDDTPAEDSDALGENYPEDLEGGEKTDGEEPAGGGDGQPGLPEEEKDEG